MEGLNTLMPYSPWDMPLDMLRDDGSMICQLWLHASPKLSVDVQWGPYGCQRTSVMHQDPYSGRDCRACRLILKQATQARLMCRRLDLDIMGLFTIRMTETGELRMIGR